MRCTTGKCLRVRVAAQVRLRCRIPLPIEICRRRTLYLSRRGDLAVAIGIAVALGEGDLRFRARWGGGGGRRACGCGCRSGCRWTCRHDDIELNTWTSIVRRKKLERRYVVAWYDRHRLRTRRHLTCRRTGTRWRSEGRAIDRRYSATGIQNPLSICIRSRWIRDRDWKIDVADPPWTKGTGGHGVRQTADGVDDGRRRWTCTIKPPRW